MAKSQQKTDQPPSLPPVYLPSDIAKALHCSEWWVKEQARKGRIPFSRVGGGYRFSADHFNEIMRIFEQRPAEPSGGSAVVVPAPRSQTGPTTTSVTDLVARPPRRSRQNQPRSTAA